MSIRPHQYAHSAPGAERVCGDAHVSADDDDQRPTIAIVVPCFNECEALPRLFERVSQVEAGFPESAGVQWCFVDDGSTDDTWSLLCRHAPSRRNWTLVRHPTNQGLAAAILTGLAHTDAPVVGSMDADCTYDPAELPAMLRRLTPDVDLVTASPYHPEGSVDGVAAWRLWVSKAASRCYRVLARNKLYTYTSCCRIYRRTALDGVRIRCRRFAGVVELLWHIDQSGGRIAEHPTVLGIRKAGRSKLRLVPVICEHMGLLSQCVWQRLCGSRRPARHIGEIHNTEFTHPAQGVANRELPCLPSTDGKLHR